MSAFVYQPFQSRTADSIGALLARSGDPAARAAELRGNAWANAIAGGLQNVGAAVARMPQERAAMRAANQEAEARGLQIDAAKRQATQAKAHDALGALVLKHTTTTDDGHTSYDVNGFMQEAQADPSIAPFAPDAIKAMQAGNDAFQTWKEGRFATKSAAIRDVFARTAAAGGSLDDLSVIALPFVRGGVLEEADFLPMATRLKEVPDAAARVKLLNSAAGVKPEYKTVNQGDALVSVTPGATPETVMTTPPKAPNSQESKFRLDGVDVIGDYVPGANGQPGRYFYNGQDVTGRAKPMPAASVTVNNANKSEAATNRNEIVEMVYDGRMAPSALSKNNRGGDYDATLAELNRYSKARSGKGIDLARLELEFQAAKRQVSAMNGPQMIWFKGLANSVVNTIEEVKTLGDELKQGSIQKWNSLTRKTVQQLYGNTPESDLANRYVVAVNTLKEEFANLANGGYAPTDAAWKLANDQINGDWGAKDLASGLTEVQRLINFRMKAFEDVQPTVPGGSSTLPSGKPTVTAPNGKTYQFETQAQADAFKKAAGIP